MAEGPSSDWRSQVPINEDALSDSIERIASSRGSLSSAENDPSHVIEHHLASIFPNTSTTLQPICQWSPIEISFRSLSYDIKHTVPRTEIMGELRKGNIRRALSLATTRRLKTVLQPISGRIRPGELLAVMGPSGSGKTTFLDVLANRVPRDRVHGDVLVNGVPLSSDIARNCFGYVWQEDALNENFTVRETLTYVASLRMDSSLPSSVRRQRIQDVLDELGLNHCADTLIGGVSFRGISGGERKRVSIAIEMLGCPSLLALDEPTTGLDSLNALHVVKSLKALAAGNRTVVCTIHQPQSSIYRLFDKLLLMTHGGHVVYFGNGGDDALEYFRQLGYPCDPHTNPCDHFMDIISVTPLLSRSLKKYGNMIPVDENSFKRVENVIIAYDQSEMKKANESFEPENVSIEPASVNDGEIPLKAIDLSFFRTKDSFTQFLNANSNVKRPSYVTFPIPPFMLLGGLEN